MLTNKYNMNQDLSYEEFRQDADWRYIFDNFADNPTSILGLDLRKRFSLTLNIHDVIEIIALVNGENDGPDWVGVFKIIIPKRDSRNTSTWNDEIFFISVTAGCDYTGWGCQEGGHSQIAPTLEDICRLGLSDEERRRLGIAVVPVTVVPQETW